MRRLFVLSILVELLWRVASASGAEPPTFTVENKVTPSGVVFTVENKMPSKVTPAVVIPLPKAKPAPALPAGSIQLPDGTWLKPHPTIPGHYTPVVGEEASRPFASRPPANRVGTPTTPATAVPAAATSPSTSTAAPRTTAPTEFKGETRTAPTTTDVRSAGLAGSIEIGSGKLIVADWYDKDGNHWIRYADGSTKVCSAGG